jgi:hypothetical protein
MERRRQKRPAKDETPEMAEQIQDRLEWKKIVEKAKTLHEL